MKKKTQRRPSYAERKRMEANTRKPIKNGVIDDHACMVEGCEFTINVIAPAHWGRDGKYVKARKVGTVSAGPANIAAIKSIKGY